MKKQVGERGGSEREGEGSAGAERRSLGARRASETSLIHVPRCLPARRAKMMAMNAKQPFGMHPVLQEPKFSSLHSGSEAMRRVCLPAPQVRTGA